MRYLSHFCCCFSFLYPCKIWRINIHFIMPQITTQFFCSGLRQPLIVWSKVDGELPYGHSVVGGTLRINRVTEEDAGTYNCTAIGEYSITHDVVHLFILGQNLFSLTIFFYAILNYDSRLSLKTFTNG